MNQKSNKSTIGILISILIGLLVTKALWVSLELKILPKSGVDLVKNSGVKRLYYHYNLASKKDKPKPIIKKSKTDTKKVTKKPKLEKFTKFSLKGIYNSKERKVIIVLYKTKSYALALNEELEGYKFVNLYPTYAIFKKGEKEYKLDLYKKEPKKASTSKLKHNLSAPSSVENKENKDKKEEPVQEGGTTYIPKNLFNKYKGDFARIRRNIDAVPNMENGKLNGFRISFVRKGSDFSKLGLKRGDILMAVNGEPLDNFKVPLEFFNNAENLTAATITIKRGNEIKELEYEVR